jgi:gluconolactonase
VIVLNRRTLLASSVAAGALAGAPLLAAETAPVLRRLSSKLDRIIAPDAQIEVIATGIRWAEGPVWVPQGGGYLLFSDPPANIMRIWTRANGVSIFLEPSGTGGLDPKLVREPGSNGLSLDHKGRLLIANSGGRSIDRLDLATKQRTTLVGTYQGKRFNSCNDLTVAKSGAIYFTDPPYGFAQFNASTLKETPVNGVYRWQEGGEAQLVDGSLTYPNGVVLSPDEKRLYVSCSDEKAPVMKVYDLDRHGMPTASRVAVDHWSVRGPGNPDGMKIAADGTMFCSGPGGMWIRTMEGEELGLIQDGSAIANCCFGEDGRTLFMTSGTRVLRMPLRINGWKA